MRPRRLCHALTAATTALVTAAVAAGCSSATATTTAGGPEKTSVTVAAVATEGAAGLYIAQEQGLFSKAGLDVTVKTVTSPAAALPALLHGGVDVFVGQYSTFIQAQAAGVGSFRVLAPGWDLGPRVEAIVVPPHSAVTTVPQLAGKTIAVNAIGGIDQLFTDEVLSGQSVKPAQVHYVAIPFQAIGAALAARRVSAAYLTEPYLTESKQNLGVQVIADPGTGAAHDMPVTGYMVTRAWDQRYPRTAAAFAEAIAQGNAEVKQNPAAFRKAMERQLHLAPQVAGAMAAGSFPNSINAAQLQRVADLLYAFGALKASFNVAGMVK
jgi:NitT/TauT family transport system substrate-binding protein